ncbi:hypothetical protein L596_007828 [Steinernema carpocapsae]|uniref:Uncharacterized protein n=1 Tax=Steinernema carpocapsae TaxID=34508 RepID=A0A4U5PBK9_STECR|nr:hypothetical protein L596_007828 [Steinernema carpocapsae]
MSASFLDLTKRTVGEHKDISKGDVLVIDVEAVDLAQSTQDLPIENPGSAIRQGFHEDRPVRPLLLHVSSEALARCVFHAHQVARLLFLFRGIFFDGSVVSLDDVRRHLRDLKLPSEFVFGVDVVQGTEPRLQLLHDGDGSRGVVDLEDTHVLLFVLHNQIDDTVDHAVDDDVRSYRTTGGHCWAFREDDPEMRRKLKIRYTRLGEFTEHNEQYRIMQQASPQQSYGSPKR